MIFSAHHEFCSRRNRNYPMTAAAQGACYSLSDTNIILKNKPGLALECSRRFAGMGQWRWTPRRHIKPVGRTSCSFTHRLCLLLCYGTWLNPAPLALERISGQGDSLARMKRSMGRPINSRSGCPEAPGCPSEMESIINRVRAVLHRRDYDFLI